MTFYAVLRVVGMEGLIYGCMLTDLLVVSVVGAL